MGITASRSRRDRRSAAPINPPQPQQVTADPQFFGSVANKLTFVFADGFLGYIYQASDIQLTGIPVVSLKFGTITITGPGVLTQESSPDRGVLTFPLSGSLTAGDLVVSRAWDPAVRFVGGGWMAPISAYAQ